MADEPIDVNDSTYVSSEDEDFDPSAAAAAENISSGSESEAIPSTSANAKRSAKQRKKGAKRGGDTEDLGFENSGDEATIRKGKKRKRKETVGDGYRKGGDDGDSDVGGDGGFVKTRSMRAAAQ